MLVFVFDDLSLLLKTFMIYRQTKANFLDIYLKTQPNQFTQLKSNHKKAVIKNNDNKQS